ncbi:MAG: hypothetical protein IJE10_00045 [Clostridia bacterium]|nr:hypothetical protein [Clostridia bacterium]
MSTRYASQYEYYSATSTVAKPYSIPVPQETVGARTDSRTRTRVREKSKININSILGIVFIAVVFLMVFRFTAMNEINSNNEKLAGQLKEVSARTDMARIALDRTTDLNYVESVAKSELSMDFPQSHQVISVSLSYPDKVVVAEAGQDGMWQRIGDFFSGIWEYLA